MTSLTATDATFDTVATGSVPGLDQIVSLDTACPLDCPDACSLTVQVRNGRLINVDATPIERAKNPLTAGFICQKVKHHAERVYGDDRILTPLIRTGAKGSGEFRQASWSEAMDVVEAKVRDAIATTGPASVVPYLYNSSGGVLAANYGDRVCGSLGFASVAHTICAATMGAAKAQVFGSMLSADPLDLAHSKYIVVWGANPTISNTHLPPVITEAVRNGAKLIVIDPRRTGLAGRAHRHIALRPGTDVVLAAAIARHLDCEGLIDRSFVERHVIDVEEFLAGCAEWNLDRAADVCGVDPSDIAATAEEWANTRPAMLRMGWGIERNRNGASGISTALALPVLMGHFGVRGSGVVLSTGGGNGVTTAKMSVPLAANDSRRSVSQNHLGDLLNSTAPTDLISVLIVQGANPAIMNLDQAAVLRGLSREDLFTVVHEQVMTDTARYADVVLPATTHFESADIADSYGSLVVQAIPAVIEPIGESRSNAAFFADFGSRFGVDGLDADDESLLASVTMKRDLGVAQEAGTMVQMVDTFPGHNDGKFHLVPPVFVPSSPTDASGDHPLTLLSPASNKLINSMFGERHSDAPELHMHVDDALARRVTHGQKVRVFNDLGSIELIATVGVDVRRGMVSVAKGFWSRSYGRDDGLTINALIPAEVEPLAGGACFNDARVDVAPA
jgi:anaerobic selenocysteine-containing dehydrogenase